MKHDLEDWGDMLGTFTWIVSCLCLSALLVAGTVATCVYVWGYVT